MGVTLKPTGDWGKLATILSTLPRRLPRALDAATVGYANVMRDHVVENIKSGGEHAGKPFAKHSPLTIAIRRFTGGSIGKPLNQSGALQRSVTVIRTSAGGTFVGISGSHPSGMSAGKLARIHEEGRTFTVPKTKKMLRFLAAALKLSGSAPRRGGGAGNTITIRIPARRFMASTFERYGGIVAYVGYMTRHVAANLAGDIGRVG